MALFRFFLLVLVLAQLVHGTSLVSTSHHRHHQHAHSVATPAGDNKEELADVSTVLTSSTAGHQGKDDDEDDSADADDSAESDNDADADDAADEAAAVRLNVTVPTAVRPSEPALAAAAPASGHMLESNYDVATNDVEINALTPQGRLTKARQQLQDNLMKQAKIAASIASMQNETGFQAKVDTESAALAAETQASSLAKMLGGMRKEMRKFASPFYLENLNSEREKLQAAEVGLKADLDAAEQAMGLGYQGFPAPGSKVVVGESTFRKPAASTALRGSPADADTAMLQVADES